MKATTRGNHPCPILKPDGGDYIDGSTFATEMSAPTADAKNPDISYYMVKPLLSCPTIQKWIDEGNAKIVVVFEQFTVRSVYDVRDGVANVAIKPHQLSLGKNAEVTPLVIATKNFRFTYNPDSMDQLISLFTNDDFFVEKGQILAYGQCREIETVESAGLSSIILISLLDKKEKEPFKIGLSGQQIEVKIQEPIKKGIEQIQHSLPQAEGLANTALAYPVFAYTIQAMCKEPDTYQDRDWFSALKNKLNDLEHLHNSGKDFDPKPSIANDPDEVWRLTNELLDDLMVTGFAKCGEGE